MRIVVTKMKIGEYKVPVPQGLSDLLSDTWVQNRKTSAVSDGYDRRVEKRDGRLFTVLTKKEVNEK